MSVNLSLIDNILIAEIDGEIDHHTCDSIRLKIDDSVINGGVKDIIVDMTEVSFMDSSGIGLVMGRYKMMEKLNGSMAIVCRNDNINKIFKMASVFKYVSCHENVGSAVAALNRGRN